MGGRTEVFLPRLEGHGRHYDINSMYPFVMLKEFPVGSPAYYKGDSARYEFTYWLEHHKGLGFIHAKVFVPKQKIPPLPIKIGKLVFPTGYLDGWFTFIELEYAIKNCGVKIEETLEVIHFTDKQDKLDLQDVILTQYDLIMAKQEEELAYNAENVFAS